MFGSNIINTKFICYFLLLSTICVTVECFSKWDNSHITKEYENSFCRDKSDLKIESVLVSVIKYDFLEDKCYTYSANMLSWSHLKVYTWGKWHAYSYKPHSYVPKCLNDNDYYYVGNNLWLSRFPKKNNRGDNSEKDKDIMNRFIVAACDDLMKNLFKVGSQDTLSITEINEFILEQLGNEQVRAINISNQVEFEHSEIYKYVDVIRSKRINDTCYKDFPVVINSHTTMFTENGLDLKNNSDIIACQCKDLVDTKAPIYCAKTVENILHTYFIGSLILNVLLSFLIIALAISICVLKCGAKNFNNTTVFHNDEEALIMPEDEK